MKSKKEKSSEGTEEKQLALGINEPFKNKFFKIKRDVDLAILKLEVRKFLKDPLVWASFVISVVLITHQFYLIYGSYAELPVYIPVFKYFLAIPRRLVSRDYIFIFPIISISVLILSFLFTSRYYNSEKFLIKILLFTLLLCLISQTIILIDLVKFF